jgi:hypothetical protein
MCEILSFWAFISRVGYPDTLITVLDMESAVRSSGKDTVTSVLFRADVDVRYIAASHDTLLQITVHRCKFQYIVVNYDKLL